jgi:hypothetical protein
MHVWGLGTHLVGNVGLGGAPGPRPVNRSRGKTQPLSQQQQSQEDLASHEGLQLVASYQRCHSVHWMQLMSQNDISEPQLLILAT